MRENANAFENAVRVEEATRGELLDERALMEAFVDNYEAAQAEIWSNQFLGNVGLGRLLPSEKRVLADTITQRYESILNNLENTLASVSQNPDYLQAQFEMDESAREAQRTMAEIQYTLFNGIDSASLSWGRISGAEFDDIHDSLNTPEEESRITQTHFTHIEARDIAQVIEGLSSSQEATNTEPDTQQVYQTTINGEPVFFQSQGGSELLFFFPAQNANPISISSSDAQSLSTLNQIVTEHLASYEAVPHKLIAASLESVIDTENGHLAPLPSEIWEEQSEFSADEQLALDSAYNMGVEGALAIKAQLLTNQLADHFGINSQLVLDGGFGTESNALLAQIFEQAGIEHTGNKQADFQALRNLYTQTFGETPSLFLTAEEINHPDIIFSNQGVFRGTHAARIRSIFDEHGVSEQTLQTIQTEMGIDLSRQFERNFQTVKSTLDELNIPAEVQGRIIATVILETGLSEADFLGIDLVGRSDKKSALEWASYLAPQTTALTTGRLSITSAGITQVNYRTAQALIAEHTGTVLPRRQLLDMLQSNEQAAVLMAVLVYYENQQQISRLRETYTPSTSSGYENDASA